jgi:hypothetical protein
MTCGKALAAAFYTLILLLVLAAGPWRFLVGTPLPLAWELGVIGIVVAIAAAGAVPACRRSPSCWIAQMRILAILAGAGVMSGLRLVLPTDLDSGLLALLSGLALVASLGLVIWAVMRCVSQLRSFGSSGKRPGTAAG